MASRSRKQATRGGSRPAVPAWIWLGVGVLLGLIVAMVFLGSDWAPMLRKKTGPQPNPEAVAPRETDPPLVEAKDKPRKNYDFYSVLPEMEVVIPDAEISAKARAEAAQAPANSATPPVSVDARYLLQVGSYPSAKAADEVKAKLAILGFVAQVYPVTINGKTWNRVRLGPYASASDLETAKASLSDNGFNAIALKEEGGH
ncbi:MAG TPA: SPOR domain-containing protein [Dokdonella sp.]|uniref:SPOR domain-containing protein n=1 Tax=Dokdonella sp. TaxID=2291710 RepID=UPI002CFD9A66|nr:SPOR domain-containing protein [Dokdonella sp.]HOX70648.1 SPOR domain-containing protein [Dokdonella sp.]HPG93931.1 SPOR domain-containing protein [Dokdonella sp.]HPN77976.1 SPOR domain-containing protein [Dokdonella sp.]